MKDEDKILLKEYPLRYHDNSNFLIDICVCGHHQHSEECYFCTCPEYKFLQKLTVKQSIDLDLQINISRRKVGFTQ